MCNVVMNYEYLLQKKIKQAAAIYDSETGPISRRNKKKKRQCCISYRYRANLLLPEEKKNEREKEKIDKSSNSAHLGEHRELHTHADTHI